MGLYWDLFYGAVIKDINDEQRDELASICKNNWWTLHQEKSVYMINAHFPPVEVSFDTLFRIDPNDDKSCFYGFDNKKAEANEKIRDELETKLNDFDCEFRWMRSFFNSNDFSYQIAFKVE
jgi:hypothetical protein